jgi:curved DNA-binding protein CbpA
MTDYFALLQQPRRPWLDPEELKQIYHQLTRTSHPDRQTPDLNSSNSDNDFTIINEAYRILTNPKLRLRHLLTLEGRAPIANGAASEELMELFAQIGGLVREIDHLIEKLRGSSNSLTQSLVRSDLIEKQARCTDLFVKLNGLYKDAMEELRTLDQLWADQSAKILDQLEKLYLKISYLMRWMDQLAERQFQLAL